MSVFEDMRRKHHDLLLVVLHILHLLFELPPGQRSRSLDPVTRREATASLTLLCSNGRRVA